jgi:hypothetical protein
MILKFKAGCRVTLSSIAITTINYIYTHTHVVYSSYRVSAVIQLQAERPGFNSLRGYKFFSTPPIPFQAPTQQPIQWVPRFLPWELKRPGNEFDHSPPSRIKVKVLGPVCFVLQYVIMAWCLHERRDNFIFEQNDETTFPQTFRKALER